ncbi:MAG: hypothetical protein DME49_05680 [Verrucomicrobia bacterium]|nr:MAG: hypothetical protein DME49_05680 [Verrucomicrobiota bacterium]PYK95310.1 MAG: hypothetical protein DME36_02495 [Verrucomicrobiota bacterium]
MKILRLLWLFILISGGEFMSRACDLCGCYTPQLEAMPAMELTPSPSWLAGWYAAASEQFTRFATVQIDGREVANPTGQYENSSITQLVAGYDVTSRFALQINLPLIYREFKRPEGFAIDRGTVSGLGDVSLLLKTVAFHYSSPARRTFEVEGKNPIAIEQEPDFTASAILLTGIKFPTGDSSRIEEEFHEVEIPGAPESGIHGHDLTLGTGSYDGVFGEQTSLRYKNVFFETNVQFTLRGDGTHQYHFANDLTWSGGPGYYFIRRQDMIIGLQFVASGEYKDVDRFRGKPAEDTGITSVFLGPRLIASRGRFSAEIAAEFPVSIDNTALQVVPDYRLRGAVSFHF